MAHIKVQSIPGHDDYCVTSDGKVWSAKTGKFLKPHHNKCGYESVELWSNGSRKRMLIHRLVAQAFIPNPNAYPQINHIDENPQNNDVSNLEWCTAKYNMNYGEGAKNRHAHIDYTKPCYRYNAIRNGKKRAVPVQMLNNGKVIAQFESANEASRQTGISQSNILRVVKGIRKTAGGYVWKEVAA